MDMGLPEGRVGATASVVVERRGALLPSDIYSCHGGESLGEDSPRQVAKGGAVVLKVAAICAVQEWRWLPSICFRVRLYL